MFQFPWLRNVYNSLPPNGARRHFGTAPSLAGSINYRGMVTWGILDENNYRQLINPNFFIALRGWIFEKKFAPWAHGDGLVNSPSSLWYSNFLVYPGNAWETIIWHSVLRSIRNKIEIYGFLISGRRPEEIWNWSVFGLKWLLMRWALGCCVINHRAPRVM